MIPKEVEDAAIRVRNSTSSYELYSLEEITKNWYSYLSQCKRYNTEPSEYYRHLKNKYNLDISEKSNTLSINSACRPNYDLSFLYNAYLPQIASFQIRYATVRSLKGLSGANLPNLAEMYILSDTSINLQDLSNINFPKLQQLCLEKLDTNPYPIHLASLKQLVITSYTCVDFKFLNESTLPNLTSLIIRCMNSINHDTIDWDKFPNLSKKYIKVQDHDLKIKSR